MNWIIFTLIILPLLLQLYAWYIANKHERNFFAKHHGSNEFVETMTYLKGLTKRHKEMVKGELIVVIISMIIVFVFYLCKN